ncbi:unnamed protein product, partial [Meganyctiphanes norvegica]
FFADASMYQNKWHTHALTRNLYLSIIPTHVGPGVGVPVPQLGMSTKHTRKHTTPQSTPVSNPDHNRILCMSTTILICIILHLSVDLIIVFSTHDNNPNSYLIIYLLADQMILLFYIYQQHKLLTY